MRKRLLEVRYGQQQPSPIDYGCARRSYETQMLDGMTEQIIVFALPRLVALHIHELLPKEREQTRHTLDSTFLELLRMFMLFSKGDS